MSPSHPAQIPQFLTSFDDLGTHAVPVVRESIVEDAVEDSSGGQTGERRLWISADLIVAQDLTAVSPVPHSTLNCTKERGETHAHKVLDAQRAFPKRNDADRIRDRVERREEGQLE